jgi:hypothetical protein
MKTQIPGISMSSIFDGGLKIARFALRKINPGGLNRRLKGSGGDGESYDLPLPPPKGRGVFMPEQMTLSVGYGHQ